VTNPTLPASAGEGEPVTLEEIAEMYTKTNGWCQNAASGDDVDRVYKDDTYTSDVDGPSTCFNFCSPFVDAPGYVGMMWRDVDKGARCICHFDDGYVPTELLAGSVTQTGRTSVGPITGSGDGGHYCFAFKGYMDAEMRAIYGNNASIDDYINFQVYGANLQVANVEKEYDQNQNHAEKIAPVFVNHTTIAATGNTWSSYLLPETVEIQKDSVLQFSFMLEEDTVDGFQAVCLDEDTEETGSNGKCFVLRSSQGWISDMVNVPTQTNLNELSYHSIPIGKFFNGPVNYLALIQDSDGQDQSLGRSSISDLKLVSLENDLLEIEIDNEMEYLKNDQFSYTDAQDETDFWMSISEDHTAVQMNGNQWKALPLNEPYYVTHSTVLELDIVVGHSVDFHAICLDFDLEATGDECVVVQSPIDYLDNFHHMTTKLETGVTKRLVIPFGSFIGLGGGDSVEVKYIAFVQDNDMSAKHDGRSTWSNLRLYDSERHNIKFSLFGEAVEIPNIQYALSNEANDDQDSRDHIMSVPADGNTIVASGNSWKYVILPSTFTATPATTLKFTFELFEETELHAICLLDSTHIQDSRNDCFFTAGVQDHDDKQGMKVSPSTEVGQEHTYEINVGSYFTGEVMYLGFIVDNDVGFTTGDVEKVHGRSSWSNIEIDSLPSLDIGLNSDTVAVENSQISYKSSSEDNTPIRDYMASISEDGSSINLVGNMWRALELPTPLSPTELGDFVVSFDFTLDEAGEIHGICFDENLRFGNADSPQNSESRRCVSTAYFQDKSDVLDVLLSDFQTRQGESHRYVLNLSKIFDKLYVNESGDPTPAPTPPPNLVHVGNNGSPSSAFPLEVCQGDCDNDSECSAGLKCFERTRFEMVPGCDGAGRPGNDYCYDPLLKETNIKYIAFINANDADRSVGDSTYGDIAITTSLSSCLSGEDFDFQLSDCTIKNFLGEVEATMANKADCTSTDPLLELFAIFDSTQEMDVYNQIEKICTSAYKLDQYDFADNTLAIDEALERQLVKEYIDGGTVMNYEAEANSAVIIGKVNDKFATTRHFSMPKHHALDNCEMGAAMCCFVASRTNPDPADNSDVCYVDMKASRYTAHVRDGWSIYSDSSDDSVYCEGFAWGNGGGIASALKGNALFKVGFMDSFSGGKVEQIPGTPLCGCMDRMPVVTNVACTDVTDPTSVVDVHFDSAVGMFDAAFTLGEITYGDCGGLNLVEHYETLVGVGKASTVDADYMHKRVVGEFGCGVAINDFLSTKGLVMS